MKDETPTEQVLKLLKELRDGQTLQIRKQREAQKAQAEFFRFMRLSLIFLLSVSGFTLVVYFYLLFSAM